MSDRQLGNEPPNLGAQPLVSVVTPCFNAAAYLRATIESVLAQRYPHCQHIVIDGGSTDGTLEILKDYPHLEWVSEKDRGQSDALNKGFRRSKGEIIGWLNADDTYEPGALWTAVRYLLKHPTIDAVYGHVNIINHTGNKVGKAFAGPFSATELLTTNMIKQPALFMRRSVIDKLSGVDERYHFVMDQELWLRMGMAGFRFALLDGAALANFRICDGTKSSDSPPCFRAEWNDVLLWAFKQPYFRDVSARTKRKALSQNQAQYHLAKMLQAIDDADRVGLTLHMLRAVRSRKNLLLNRGLWRFAATGILGLSRDKLRRFKKNTAVPHGQRDA